MQINLEVLFLAYAAPEVVLATAYDPLKSDIWSLGVILFIMVHGTMPFDDKNLARMLKEQTLRQYHANKEIMDKLSRNCVNMINALFEPDPLIRICAKEICEMPFTMMATTDATS